MFPKFSGSSTTDPRGLSHEWRTFFLNNGTDFSSWQQFDRNKGNLLYSFSGATTYHPDEGARYAGDMQYEYFNYVRIQDHPVQALLPNKAAALYFPAKHRLTSQLLELDIVATPLVKEPLLAFPIEYYHTPVRLQGTQHGKPVEGLGSFELTLAFYRDFELIEVLANSIRHYPNGSPASPELTKAITDVSDAIQKGRPDSAKALADGNLRKQLQALPKPQQTEMNQILDDLIAAIGRQ
jgi:hypothetical protein